ncbi:DDRGK domain-containing protein 1-like [Vicia villosa]|uniref:DDRGK domain-containing protein 1-like n=1 Tax=Vicia villosa TaxID=3911 RepID=UPI00273B1FDB|nr:DDRGK domain-containing protein 1-like [Vicia villosa]
MDELVVAILSMLFLAALIPLYLWKRHHDSRSSSSNEEPQQAPQRETVVRATATRRMRRRPAASGASTSSAQPATQQESADESDNEGGGDDYEAKASKKKEIKRQEREARRQAEEATRDSKQSKQDRYSEMRRLKDEEREAQERKLEEEAKAQKAKEEEAAAFEFEKWKGEFSVDDEGTLEEEQDKTEDLLANFVEYIKKHKCVPLEDLAAEFKLRTQECINRIASLESMGRLSGVMDDRGKFIYISQEEMKAVADYIKRQGRVSISHLASKSNQFIDLEPKTHYNEDISNMEEITVN